MRLFRLPLYKGLLQEAGDSPRPSISFYKQRMITEKIKKMKTKIFLALFFLAFNTASAQLSKWIVGSDRLKVDKWIQLDGQRIYSFDEVIDGNSSHTGLPTSLAVKNYADAVQTLSKGDIKIDEYSRTIRMNNQATLNVSNDTNSLVQYYLGTPSLFLTEYANDDSFGATIRLKKSRGNILSRSATQQNDELGRWVFDGHSSQLESGARISAIAESTASFRDFSAKLTFQTRPAGFNMQPITRMEIGSNGSILCNNYGAGAKEAADLSKTASPCAAAFATDGTLIEKAAKAGLASASTNASGDITITIGATMPDATYSATVTPEVAGGTQQSAVVISKTTTSFVVRVFSGTTALASTSATLNWSVQDY